MEYLLVKKDAHIFWAKESDTSPLHYTDYRSFKIPKSSDDNILERCEASSFEELDFNKTTLVDASYDSGWISPLGDFIGCKPYDHDAVAWFIFHSRGSDLEKFGWVRLYSIKKRHYDSGAELNEAQLAFFE